MKLFICSTPLHCAIANAIIVNNNYRKDECQLFYFSFKNKNQEIHRKYFSLLAGKCQKADFVCIDRVLVLELFKIFTRFYKTQFSVIHAANIDMPLIHFILSYSRFEKFCSFDDGIGNIVPTSVFYKRKKRTAKLVIRDLIYRILGNRFDLDRCKKSTEKHYSIYQRRDNIVPDIEFVAPDFFVDEMTLPIEFVDADKSTRATVLLGTVYSELICSPGLQTALIARMQQFIDTQQNVYLISHPRDRDNYFANVTEFAVDEVAEKILLNLKQHYVGVDVFGFASSAQFNLSISHGIKQYYFTSGLIKSAYADYIQQAESFGFSSIDLDSMTHEE